MLINLKKGTSFIILMTLATIMLYPQNDSFNVYDQSIIFAKNTSIENNKLNVEVKSGESTISLERKEIDFGDLESGDSLVSDIPNIFINEYSGSGKGMSVSLQSSQLKTDRLYETIIQRFPKEIIEKEPMKLDEGSLTLNHNGVLTSEKEGEKVNLENKNNLVSILDNGSSISLFDLNNSQSMGRHTYVFNDDALSLKIPLRAKTAIYKTELSWKLTFGP